MYLSKSIIPEQICLYNPKNVIFLDIDGVLRTHLSDVDNHNDNIPKFVFDRLFSKKSVNILNESLYYVDYDIVVTSTWRNFCDINSLINIFKLNGVKSSIIGITGVELERGLEILNWVSTYNPANWIVIDDNIRDIIKHIPNDKIINPSTTTGLINSNYIDEIINLL